MNVLVKMGIKREDSKFSVQQELPSIKKFREKVKVIFHTYQSLPTNLLSSTMNPLIRGWANSFYPFYSRKTFELNYLILLYTKCMKFGLLVKKSVLKLLVNKDQHPYQLELI